MVKSNKSTDGVKGGNDMVENTKIETEEKEASITFKKSSLWKLGTFVFLGLFIISLFTGGLGGIINNSGSPTGNVVNNPSGGDTVGSGNIKVAIESNDPILGDKNAPITIVEFSDFQCPFCERAFSGAIAQFKASDYFKKGQVNLIYKHFPLTSIHPYAQKAAEAAECANRQGKFWQYHDKLFTNQQALDIASLKSYASQIGLDTGKFNKCLDSGEATAEISKESQQAQSAGGQGTPYFVLINKKGQTQVVSGAVPFSQFESAIKSLQ